MKVNLQRVVSIPGFIGCVHDAMIGHPVKRLRRAAQRQVGVLEKEIGFDIRVIKGSMKRPGVPEQAAETLHTQLMALRSLSEHLVVVFDGFQRPRHCRGDPLSIIRSALSIGGVALHLRGEVRDVFFDWLREQRPDLIERYECLYARGAYAPPAERERLAELARGGLVPRRRFIGAGPGALPGAGPAVQPEQPEQPSLF